VLGCLFKERLVVVAHGLEFEISHFVWFRDASLYPLRLPRPITQITQIPAAVQHG
jgi:hypothetical protein